MLTLRVHSLDGSQLHRGAHAILVLGDDPEHVILALHDAHALTLGRGRFHGLSPGVHLGISSLHHEASQIATAIVLGIVPVQEDHLPSHNNRFQVCDGPGDV